MSAFAYYHTHIFKLYMKISDLSNLHCTGCCP